MRNVVISTEHFTAGLSQEIGPLGQKCWDECSVIKKDTCAFHGERGFIIEPDTEQYHFFANKSSLVVATLRDGGRLHGYGIGILYRSLHHKPVIVGNVDSFYIEPDYRAYGPALIAHLESEFKSRKVVIIGWATTPGGALYGVLKKLGYAPDDVLMEKRLCALHSQ